MDRKKYRYRYRVTVLVIMIAAGIFSSMKAVSLIFYTSLLECFGALIVDRPKGWIVPVLLVAGILDGILVVKKLLELMS